MLKQAFFGTVVVGTALCLSIATPTLADDKHHHRWQDVHQRGGCRRRQVSHHHRSSHVTRYACRASQVPMMSRVGHLYTDPGENLPRHGLYGFGNEAYHHFA